MGSKVDAVEIALVSLVAAVAVQHVVSNWPSSPSGTPSFEATVGSPSEMSNVIELDVIGAPLEPVASATDAPPPLDALLPQVASAGPVAGLWSGAAAEREECTHDVDAAWLDSLMSGTPAGFAGADHPRVYPLLDGRVLWSFQDVFFGRGTTLDPRRFAHNAGFVQTGRCIRPLRDPDALVPTSFIGADLERPGSRWFWALDGEIGADGLLWVFVAEMANPNGTGAAEGASPVRTWSARIDTTTLQVRSFEPAPDDSAALFGWSIVSDETHSYLYGHCFRQFLPEAEGALLGTDPSCSPYTELARVERGRFDQAPEYFDGAGWVRDPARAQPVLDGDLVHGASVERIGDAYVSVTKADDWYGDELVVEVASAPTGPWFEVRRQRIEPRCAACNTYGTFVLPWLDDGQVVVLVSNNAWDMRRDAYPFADRYRPSAVLVPLDDV